MKKLFHKEGTLSVISSVIAIIIGLLFGLVVLYIINAPRAMESFISMLTIGLSDPAKFSKVLYQAAPLIMTGLAVGFAFKTGLFNIGATGQYTVGAFAALVSAIQFQMPWYICILAAMIAGAFWGMFPGLFKALFNVNEVITSIMFNWIGLFMVNLCLLNMEKMRPPFWVPSPIKDRTASLKYANPEAIIPKAGLDELFGSPYINISFIIAIVFAIIMYIVLNKTTFGYELKACGHNREAARYAGINAKRNIVLSMVISGALAGVAGGLYYLSGEADYNILKVLLPMGFNGIPVALLATSNPIGTIFSAFFVSYIQVGGESMQPYFAVEMIDIIISVIIYLAAFALLTRGILKRFIKSDKGNVNAEPAPLPEEEAEPDQGTAAGALGRPAGEGTQAQTRAETQAPPPDPKTDPAPPTEEKEGESK